MCLILKFNELEYQLSNSINEKKRKIPPTRKKACHMTYLQVATAENQNANCKAKEINGKKTA